MRYLVSLTLALFVGMARADEAVRTDGQHVEGRLSLDSPGRPRFTPLGKETALAFDSIQDIRFSSTEVPPFLVGTPHRLELANEQQITGELLRMDAEVIHLRTFWSEDIKIARRAVVAITQPFGLTTIFHEDFDANPIRMQLAGSPRLDDKQRISGQRSLTLNAVGQSALYNLPAPLNGGRIGLHFRDSGDASGARWLVEAEFADARTNRSVGVVLAGEGDAHLVESDVPAGETRRIRRMDGWHRLSIRFRREYLLVGVDDRLLFESGTDGPGAPLKQVRLTCRKRGPDESPRGAMHFDDLTLAKTLEPIARAPGDPTQDELWLASGDQLFGQVERADRYSVFLRVRGRAREVTWTDLRGIYLKRDAAAQQKAKGTHVRVWFRSGLGSQPDQLEGVLEALGDQKLTLRHLVLGRIELARARLSRLRPLEPSR
jgi:hypothetical protein